MGGATLMLTLKKLKFNQRLRTLGLSKEDYGKMVFALSHPKEEHEFALTRSEMIEIVDYISGKTNKRPRR